MKSGSFEAGALVRLVTSAATATATETAHGSLTGIGGVALSHGKGGVRVKLHVAARKQLALERQHRRAASQREDKQADQNETSVHQSRYYSKYWSNFTGYMGEHAAMLRRCFDGQR